MTDQTLTEKAAKTTVRGIAREQAARLLGRVEPPADELKLEDGIYRITTMAGGVMEIPVDLVERVIACVLDKEVEEQRGTVPAGATRPPTKTMGDRSNVTKVPPVGSRGAGGRVNKSPILGGGKGRGATPIPPRGGKSLGKPGGDKTIPEKGGKEKK